MSSSSSSSSCNQFVLRGRDNVAILLDLNSRLKESATIKMAQNIGQRQLICTKLSQVNEDGFRKYMETGTFSSNSLLEVEKLLELSRELKLQGLEVRCIDMVWSLLTLHNCLQCWWILHQYGGLTDKKQIMSFLQTHFAAITISEHWKSFPASKMLVLMSQRDLFPQVTNGVFLVTFCAWLVQTKAKTCKGYRNFVEGFCERLLHESSLDVARYSDHLESLKQFITATWKTELLNQVQAGLSPNRANPLALLADTASYDHGHNTQNVSSSTTSPMELLLGDAVWIEAGKLSQPRASLSVCLSNDDLGWVTVGGMISRTNMTPAPFVEVYAGQVSRGETLYSSHAMSNCSMVWDVATVKLDNDHILTVGGWNNLAGRLDDRLFMVHPKSKKEVQVWPKMPQGRAGACAGVLPVDKKTQEYLLIVAGGGIPDEPTGTTSVIGLSLFKEVNGDWAFATEWKHLPPMTVARSCAASCVFDKDKFVVLGGYGPDDEVFNTTEYITLVPSPKWNALKSFHCPRHSFGAVAVHHQNIAYIVIVGGRSNKDLELDSLEVYDGSAQTWVFPKQGPRLNRARCGFGIFLLPEGHLHVAGGISQGKLLACVEKLQLKKL